MARGGDGAQRFGNPARKDYYDPRELAAYARRVREPLVEPFRDDDYYTRRCQEMMADIERGWEGAGAASRALVRAVLRVARAAYPLDGPRRRNGTPYLSHMLEGMHRMTLCAHNDAVCVGAYGVHDIFEDSAGGLVRRGFASPGALYSELIRGSGLRGADARELALLARAVVWVALCVTNDPLDIERREAHAPSDFLRPDVLGYYGRRAGHYVEYLRGIRDAPTLAPRIVKKEDTFNNTGDLIELGSRQVRDHDLLRLFFITALKASLHYTSDRKLVYTVPYYTMHRNIGGMLGLLADAYPPGHGGGPGIVEALDPAYRWEAMGRRSFAHDDFPYDIFRRFEYYTQGRSEAQRKMEIEGVVWAPPRDQISSEMFRRLPYARSPVITILAPEVEEDHGVMSHPIEMQIPRQVGAGDPADPSNFMEVDARRCVELARREVERRGLPFEVQEVASLLAGPDSMDFILLRLTYVDGEGRHFIARNGRTTHEQQERYRRIRQELEEIGQMILGVEGRFERVRAPLGGAPE